MPRHVRKGDTVMITAGSNKGTVGEVLRVLTETDQVIIKGVNLRTKHLKPNRVNPQGGIITKEAPLHISNVSPVVDGKPSRVRFVVKPDGSKVRVAVRGGKELGVVRGPEAKKPGSPGTPGKTVKR
ncbi:50S ribosomal protein L24 [Leptolyngbya sp. 15MV]|nr:50S ribosomal protein L24 [Leptolyngbya sp. 15MV]